VNNIATILQSIVEGHPRSRLADLEWEQLPNEFRGLPRLPNMARHAPITRATPVSPMSPVEWRAWGIML
jgi:hypothetical protein